METSVNDAVSAGNTNMSKYSFCVFLCCLKWNICLINFMLLFKIGAANKDALRKHINMVLQILEANSSPSETDEKAWNKVW